MKTNRIYNFFFHPFKHKESEIKVLSTITVIALSILTAGGFLIAFGIVNWKDRHIKPQNPKNNKIANVVFPKISNANVTKVKDLKEANIKQVNLFEEWASKGDWKRFRPEYSHYDWWAFPVSRSSAGHGDRFAVGQAEIEALKNDPDFMRSYRRGVELVIKSWGWDLKQEMPVPPNESTTDQMWTGYGVRLGKMADSLRLFGEKDLFKSVQKFYEQICMPQLSKYPLEGWVSSTLDRNFPQNI